MEDRIGEPIVAVEQGRSAKALIGRAAAAPGLDAGYAGFVIARRHIANSAKTVLVTSTVFPSRCMHCSMSLKLG